jgi:PII-like signaling protein
MSTAHTLIGPAKILWIFIDETDRHETMPLYEAILRRLRMRDVAGGTVMRGIMGYGAQHRIYGSTTLGMADNRPVTIIVIESEEKINAILPEIEAMVPEGLVMVSDTVITKYAARPRSGA